LDQSWYKVCYSAPQLIHDHFRPAKPPHQFNPTSPQVTTSHYYVLRPGIRNLSKYFQLSAAAGKLNVVTCRFGPAGFLGPASLFE
jgi:hypothetical protein